ncbi:lysozyme [Novosphingobium marinum]|uniref:Lysozyme n=1 Tax=Novosphingobium marinum TaxID=1514948 RepID=A0A7Z0BUB9_9SPHN|nr:glycoside hydrolase family 25 protein [Novosphingobium marinum]NYH96936.1 lysozyme [Novosphingobium marinum]GGC42229.1 lysozyme [Novosphingobium marinum]
MARRSGNRKTGNRARLRLFAALLLVAVLAAGYAWWHMRGWNPDRGDYAVQGLEVGAEDGRIDWRAARAIGADFAYIDASASAFARDPRFVGNLEAAKKAGVQAGAVHRYDPCQPADKQAANFVTVVPRDAKLLPPAVELDLLADQCPVAVSDAKVESELMTFINQLETHTGKPTILKVTPAFEERYGITARLDRNLWLVRDRFQPDYAGRPWTMWTANTSLATEAAAEPLRWVVVQP